jgi:hypothetical protein
VGDVDRHALAAQPAGNCTGQPALVFGDQDPHRLNEDDASYMSAG